MNDSSSKNIENIKKAWISFDMKIFDIITINK
jgi:hypothetical protein